MNLREIRVSQHLNDVRYEIRGSLARRADELERAGFEVTKLNIGNPGAFGFEMPATMRRAIVENLHQAHPYCHQKGIFPAREAVAIQQQDRGVMDVSVDDVIIGNGVSELIMMCLRALLNAGDEVLVPRPDYPLWTAAVVIHEAKAVHYDCPPENGFLPDLDHIRSLINERTRAIVIINPNNPTGAVYNRELLQELVDLASRHGLVIFADEIYDEILYDGAEHVPVATLHPQTLCATFSGLSKVYRACGLRVGWVSFSGEKSHAKDYLNAVELLASLRLCANVPGQWAVQTALGGYQSICELTSPGGRLYESRKALVDGVAASKHLEVTAPDGALYAFVRIKTDRLPDFEDTEFARELLEREHILIAPGTSFNVEYRDHFRTTLLPPPRKMQHVLSRIDALLGEYEHHAPARQLRVCR